MVFYGVYARVLWYLTTLFWRSQKFPKSPRKPKEFFIYGKSFNFIRRYIIQGILSEDILLIYYSRKKKKKHSLYLQAEDILY